MVQVPWSLVPWMVHLHYAGTSYRYLPRTYVLQALSTLQGTQKQHHTTAVKLLKCQRLRLYTHKKLHKLQHYSTATLKNINLSINRRSDLPVTFRQFIQDDVLWRNNTEKKMTINDFGQSRRIGINTVQMFQKCEKQMQCKITTTVFNEQWQNMIF